MKKIALALSFSLSLTFNYQVYSMNKATEVAKKVLPPLIKYDSKANSNTLKNNLKKLPLWKKIASFTTGAYIAAVIMSHPMN